MGGNQLSKSENTVLDRHLFSYKGVGGVEGTNQEMR